MPCWNILSIRNVGGDNSFDVHSRVLLRKRVNSYCTVPLRAFLSKPLVTCALPCRCRRVGSGLGVRFGFELWVRVRVRVGVKVSVTVRVWATTCFAYTSLVCAHIFLMSRLVVWIKTRQKTTSFYCQTFSPSLFVCSPKRLSSNRLTRTLRDSLWQGHTLRSRWPRRSRPAPLVLQVLVSQYVIDWGEGLGVLDITGNSLFVFISSPPPFLSSPGLLFP